MRRARTTDGLTLIELVVALGIFAMVAVMGVQSLSVSLTHRDRLTGTARATDTLGQGMALLRNDLAAAVPMLFFPPAKGAPASALRPLRGGQGFSLSITGQPGLPVSATGADSTAQQRVDWRYDPNASELTRTLWPTLYPANASQQGPEVIVLDGVTGLRLRSYWSAGKGWVAGVQSGIGSSSSSERSRDDLTADGDKAEGVAREVYSSRLPHAMEVTIVTRDFGEIVLVEYFQ